MRYLASLLLVLELYAVRGSISYNPEDYLEVYPDPTDPAVLRGRTPLHFALIQSLGGPLSQFDGSGSVAGVKVALDRINSDSTLLPGYTLHYTFADSKCNRTEGLNAFFYQILREPTKLAVVGSGCSVTTEPTAEISHFYNISHISCVSSSTELRNRIRFPDYFQLLSTEETLAFAYYGVIKEFGWRRVALIVQNENLFTVTIDRLEVLLDRDGVEHSTKLFNTNEGIAGLGEEPFDMKARIFLLAMYSVNARPLLCEAYNRNIRLPQHLLLTPGWYSRLWWTVDNEGLNCTVKERESVLASSLAFLHFVFLNETADVNLTTTTGITGGEFLAKEQEFLGRPPLNLTLLEYSQYCYDATWTLAYALNQTLDSIADPVLNAELAQAYNVTPPFGLEDFTYDSHRLLDVMFDYISSTNFNGVTGPVSFGDQGIRNLNELIIFQFRNRTNAEDGSVFLDWVQIGNVVPAGIDDYNFTYGPGEDIETVFQGLVPYDGVPEKVTVSIHPALTAVYIVLACVGIAFAIACLVFNFLYRNSKLIKLASNQLNYLIGAGAIVLYLDIIFSVIPSTDPNVVGALCNLTPWLSAIGYSLCYGTILVKMVRVYYIFNNPSTNKKGIKDWKLMLGVASLIGIDLTILVVYTVVEGLEGNLGPRLVRNAENTMDVEGELDVITEYCVYICDSVPRDIFLGILYGYKMVLQAIALLLAFSIRKVKVKGLDDSKYIGAAIYVTSIVLAVIIVATYSLKDIVNGFAALFSTGFLFGTTVILVLVFVPLMVGLYEDPQGENIFKKSSMSAENSLAANMTRSNKNQVTTRSETDTLRMRIKDLEDKLEASNKVNQESSHVSPTHSAMSDPRMRSESTLSALEHSNMVTGDEVRKRTFSGTIWDTPEESQENGNGTVGNGNGTVGNGIEIDEQIKIRDNDLLGSTTL